MDNIENYKDTLPKLIAGINKACEIIKPTYGPHGGNVVIEESQYPGHRIANDGKLIIDSILLSDPVEQIGVNLLKEACDKQEKDCGDGRKTAVILTASILNEGMKKDFIPLEFKRKLDKALEKVIESIDEQKREIPIEEVGKIAEIASESKEIGKLIGEIYPQIGREGIIEIEASPVPSTHYEIINGVRLHGARMWSGWFTDADSCTLDDPKILIVREKITTLGQLEPIYLKLAEAKITTLVLYCDDIELTLASRLAQNTAKAIQGEGRVKTLIIKSPVLWKDWIYEDLQHLTGATAISLKDGHTFTGFQSSWLGTCTKWIANKEESRLQGTKDVTEHVEKLKKEANPENQLLTRTAWLNTKTAVLKVGANTESELSWKIRKTRDATHASYYALKDGVVDGAGLSLVMASTKIKSLLPSLCEPNKILIQNAHDKPDFEGIIDPSIVIKSAITTAISLASSILTTTGVIIIPQSIKEEIRKINQQRMP